MSERAGDDRIRPTAYSNTLVHLREAFSPVDHARIFDLMSFTADTKSMPLLGSSEINDTLQAGAITRSRAYAIMQHRVQEWHKHSGARLNVVLRLLSASKIGIAFEKLTGHPPWLVLDITRTAFKRQVDSGERRVYLPWHADMRASYNCNIMTAWVADCAAGTDIPGLCFYRFQKSDEYHAFLKSVADPRAHYSQEELTTRYPSGEAVVPQTGATDALLFGKHVLHKTQDNITTWTQRRSVEFRVSHPSIWGFGDDSKPRLSILARVPSDNQREIIYLLKPDDITFRCSVGAG